MQRRTLLGRSFGAGLALSLSLGAALTFLPACHAGAAGSGDEGFRLIHSDELAAMLKDTAHPVHLFDANGDAFRKRYGVIPGAAMLSHFKKYALSELPADKAAALVFYCANEH